MSLSEVTMPSRPKSKSLRNGTCATSCLSARVAIFMSLTPASRLTLAECGPAMLITTGASMVSPADSVTPAMRPSALRIRATSLLNRKVAPLASAARWALWLASCGSPM